MAAISRRNFLEGWFDPSQNQSEVNTGLEEYTQVLSRLQVRHLLRRATFSLTNSVIDKYVGKTAGEIVDVLFDNADKNTSPIQPFFVNDVVKNPQNLNGKQKEEEAAKRALHLGDYNKELGKWWVILMKNDRESILEKTVLFWHDHFATQFAICDNIPAVSMYKQNDLFRKNYAGNFRTLLEQISVDGAMLRYLNGNENLSDSPNENYARELMELFSLGVGNYTEQDVREAAKILTGWKITMFADEGTPYKAFLNTAHFDANPKLFMGEVFAVNYDINEQNVFNNSVRKLIDVILDKKGQLVAKFLAKKMFEYYVYSNPSKTNQVVVDELAKVLYDNKFEIKPMLKKLFKSQHFFDDLNIGIQLKSPTETIIGMLRHLEYNDLYARNIMATLGLELFNPPNVAGWKGYRSWISTKTLPSTIHFLKEIINTNNDLALGNWANTIESSGDVHILTERMLELFMARPLSAERIKKYENVLLAGAPDYEWYEIFKNKEQAGQKIRNLLFEIIKAPDYFLF